MNSLENRWKQLKLSNEEDDEIVVNEAVVMEKIKKGKNSIIGKLHMDQTITKEVMQYNMS